MVVVGIVVLVGGWFRVLVVFFLYEEGVGLGVEFFGVLYLVVLVLVFFILFCGRFGLSLFRMGWSGFCYCFFFCGF